MIVSLLIALSIRIIVPSTLTLAETKQITTDGTATVIEPPEASVNQNPNDTNNVKDDCFVGQESVPCPSSASLGSLDVLPPNPNLEVRNDFVFIPIFLIVVLGFVAIFLLKLKIFGKTLGEYLKPIWPLPIVSLLVVGWQYLFGLRIDDNLIALKISQIIWEIAVGLSVYLLSRNITFSYRHIAVVGVFYSLLIHGIKVSIRYFFYDKTLWYVLDRFLYGSLLVMLIAVVLGSVFVYLRNSKRNH